MGWILPETVLVAFVVAALAAAVSTPPIARAARRFGVLDRPAGHKRHDHATPLLGGLAIAVGVVVAGPLVAWPSSAPTPFGLALAAGTMLLLGAGWRDDVRPLGVAAKLAVQIVAATGLALTLDGSPLLRLSAAFVLVLLTNSFNLLDNADGSTASVGAVTGMASALWIGSQDPAALTAACLAGGCAGFLIFNRPPARIFMGDAGSLAIGFLLAGLATGHVSTGPSGTAPLVSVTVFVCLFFVPLLDTGLVSLSRLRRGKNPLTTPGRDHLAHRLRRLGLGAGASLAALVGLSLVGVGLGAATLAGHLRPLWVWGFFAVLGLPAFVYLESLLEPAPPSAVVSTESTTTPTTRSAG